MILPSQGDPRLITQRRGGTLAEADHHLLALWAASCAEHVLGWFEDEVPGDQRPREAVDLARAWACGKAKATAAKVGAYHANAAARGLSGAAKFAALAAGQAAAVAHVAAHELGAAAYAIRAAMAAAGGDGAARGLEECLWQRSLLPEAIRALVLDDEARRNELCWKVFSLDEGV